MRPSANIIRSVRAAGILLALVFSGCIRNDIPYPLIQANILEIAAEGETSAAVIDERERSVMLALAEQTDPKTVKFTSYKITEGSTSSPDLLQGAFDLTSNLEVDVTLYQTYTWTISATHNIERYFTVEGQVGATDIDVPGRRVIVRLPETTNLERVRLLTAKLGPADVSTYTPSLEPGYIDLSTPLDVDVKAFGVTETWTIYAELTEALVTTTSADAWSQVIWVYAEAASEEGRGFQYRKADSDEWNEVPQSLITSSGGTFSAYIPHLTPLTEYVVRSYVGTDIGNEITVTTGSTPVIPDADFDQWWLNGRIWCPWAEVGERFWDTGNTGAATLGQSNVQPSDDVPPGVTDGKSAKLETRFVGIGVLGKLAAGSIYTGSFKKVDGTNGILDFGRPWTERPTKLRGYFKYTTAPINYVGDKSLQDLMGRPDSCHIYVALTDWSAPFEVRTNPRNQQLFDKNSSSVIAYGELICGSDTDGWVEFEIPLVYRSTAIKPSYLQITCAASKYGDFFTGGSGAVLFVDELSFSYDY